MHETKKQNYLKGAAILAAASIIVKIVSAIYKIPLFNDNVLGDAGAGTFQVTYSIYNLMLAISTAGIPVALSRMVSSASANNKIPLVKRYFSVAMPIFMLIGLVVMAVMFIFADSFAALLRDTKAAPGIRVLAPAVFFVCIISVYRGYAQGFENMIPTAVSQIVEVVCKTIFGIAIALWLVHMGYAQHIVSAGATMGVTLGLGLCIPILIWYKRKIDRRLPAGEGEDELPSRSRVLGRILKVSVPITLSSSFMSIMVVIDNSIVLGRLQYGLNLSELEARQQFGIYTKGLTVYSLPPALVVPVSMSIIPAIAAALARRREGEASSIMQSSVKLVNLIAMPAAAGLMVLASPILVALFNDARQVSATVMIVLGAASFFVSLQYITTAILQSNGHEKVALMTFPIGAFVNIMLGFILVPNPKFGIVGSTIGTLACFVVISAINIVLIMKMVKEKPKFTGAFIKPLICSAIMSAVAYLLYMLVSRLGSGLIGTGRFAVILYLIVAIVVAIAVYFILIIATRTVTKEDMLLVPKGEKLAKLLHIR